MELEALGPRRHESKTVLTTTYLSLERNLNYSYLCAIVGSALSVLVLSIVMFIHIILRHHIHIVLPLHGGYS